MAWSAIANGILFGIGAAAPIGPVNVEIARRTLRTGARAGFLVGCGAVTIDCLYLILSSLLFEKLNQQQSIRWLHLLKIAVALVGGIFLAYLGTMSLWAARRTGQLDQSTAPPPKTTPPYLTGLMMTLLNPMTLAFWFSTGPTRSALAANSLIFLTLGVFIGTFAWVCFFTTLLHVVGRRHRTFWLVAADVLGGLTLLYFAGLTIWRIAQQNL